MFVIVIIIIIIITAVIYNIPRWVCQISHTFIEY
jgi:hypothetical protein